MAIEDHGRYRWAVVCMLWVICFFNYADRQAIYSVYPLLKRELHVSDLELGILGSAFMWVYAFSAPFGGYLGERFRLRCPMMCPMAKRTEKEDTV
jgi:sugar phosphate permease